MGPLVVASACVLAGLMPAVRCLCTAPTVVAQHANSLGYVWHRRGCSQGLRSQPAMRGGGHGAERAGGLKGTPGYSEAKSTPGYTEEVRLDVKGMKVALARRFSHAVCVLLLLGVAGANVPARARKRSAGAAQGGSEACWGSRKAYST
jgi:hypothetical protein